MSETAERFEGASRQPEAPKRALEDIAADREADLAEVEDRHREAVSFDDRCTAIGGCLMDLYVSDEDAATDLEPYVDEGRFPDEAALVLAHYEAGKRERKPDYDITTKPARMLTRVLKREMIVRADQEEAEEVVEAENEETVVGLELEAGKEVVAAEAQEAVIDEAEATAAAEVAAKAQEEAADAVEAKDDEVDKDAAYAALLTEYGDQPMVLLQQITSSDAAPEAEKARAAAFLRIRALAQTETDAALITRRIEAQDFSEGVPDPGAFIRTEIFSSSGHDTGFSEAMQEAVAKEFGIERFPKVDTGSEVRTVATATTTDPKTGETVPAYTEEHPAEFRPGVGAWSSDGEDVYLTAAIPGHPPVFREVTGWSNDDIGLLAEAMGFAAGMEQYGATGFVEDVYKIDFNVLGDSAFDRDSLRGIRQMISAMVGSFEGYDGDIFDVRDKVGLLQHQARLLNPEDTAYGFENDREATRSAARKLGLRDADDRINLDVLKEFGRYSQETYLSGDPSHADLHAYLYRQFPQFVEAPQGETKPAGVSG